jgi:tRNA threonylcarbamoyladenosine biosynthesis protein TsaB
VRILALDTSTECCSAALRIGDSVELRRNMTRRGHAALILPMVDSLLRAADLRLQELDGIAFGRGPGSFTGLRIAAGVAQGLGLGAELPVVGISSLAAVGEQVPAAIGEQILVCNDARMSEIYLGRFQRDAAGVLRSVADEVAVSPGDVPIGKEAAHAAGNGLHAYPDLAGRLLSHAVRLHEGLFPQADAVASLSIAAFAAGKGKPASQAQPVYIRDNVVQRRG